MKATAQDKALIVSIGDVPQFSALSKKFEKPRNVPYTPGFNIPADTLRRLWRMLAHSHGQQLNSSRLGEAIGVSHTTIRSYLDLLSQTFMIRLLPPQHANLRKRLVKSPKIYIRDSGILHALLEIEDREELWGHPIYGASWEGLSSRTSAPNSAAGRRPSKLPPERKSIWS